MTCKRKKGEMFWEWALVGSQCNGSPGVGLGPAGGVVLSNPQFSKPPSGSDACSHSRTTELVREDQSTRKRKATWSKPSSPEEDYQGRTSMSPGKETLILESGNYQNQNSDDKEMKKVIKED